MTKFYIDQHGCAKNQTDGELIVGFLLNKGYIQTLDASEADFIFVNSCGFIESAKKESIQSIYDIKANYPEAKIILTGCLAERYASMLGESMPELDGIFGNGDLSKIADFMDSIAEGKRQIKTFPQEGICSGNRPVLFNFKSSAFVKITEGCSNHCSFCAIPLIRGEVRSRTAESVINEIKELISNGVYEINLIGQDLAAYGTGINDNCFGDGPTSLNTSDSPSGLKRLLEKISLLEGDFLVRLLYIHPDHFNKDIIEVIKKDNRFAKYFDIPFQSGDDEIILKMNRKGSQKSYVDMIKYIKSELPGCAIRTTFLTGFPGETDAAAENTKNFLKLIEPTWSGCFPYSREEDTPAYSMKNKVSAKIAQKRAEALEEIQSEISINQLNAYVGKEYKVLIEEIIENNSDDEFEATEGLALGRTWFQAPEVDGCVVVRYDLDDEKEKSAVKPGNVVKVKVLSNTGVDLDSRLISLEKEFSDSKIIFRVL